MAPPYNFISHWSLGEVSGTRVDNVVASANDLTDINTVTQAVGKIGNAAQFTAANFEALGHADNASLSTGDIDFTISAWVYLDTIHNGAILTKYQISGNQREYLLFYNNNDHAPNNRFSFVVSSNGTAITTIDATTFGAASTATWYFVVAWHDAVNNQIGISVNDVANTAAYSSGVFDSTAPFRIGELLNGASQIYPFNGRIDEAWFEKRMWSASDITDTYNAGAGRDYAYLSTAAASDIAALYLLANSPIQQFSGG
jgi:hypothetical protein